MWRIIWGVVIGFGIATASIFATNTVDFDELSSLLLNRNTSERDVVESSWYPVDMQPCSSPYRTYEDNIYYSDLLLEAHNENGEWAPVELSDSFVVHCSESGFSDYAKNTESVWHKTQIILGADPASFEIIGDMTYRRPFGKDKSHVYKAASCIFQIADPDTFELIAPYYAKDKYNVYFDNRRDCLSIIESADPTTFSPLGTDLASASSSIYSRDKTSIFCEDSELIDVDGNTFWVHNESFAADRFGAFDGCARETAGT